MELDWGCLATQIYASNPGRSKMEAKQPMMRLKIGQFLANVTYLATHLYLEYRDNCYAVKASRDRQAGRLVMTIHVSQSRLHPERTSGSLRPSESMHLPLAEYTTPRDDDVVGSRIQSTVQADWYTRGFGYSPQLPVHHTFSCLSPPFCTYCYLIIHSQICSFLTYYCSWRVSLP